MDVRLLLASPAQGPGTAEDDALPEALPLPTEIIDMIAESLSLADLQNVRLACREFNGRFTGQEFVGYFRDRVTDLSTSSLERLEAVASHPKFQPIVRRLKVVAVIYDTLTTELHLLDVRARMNYAGQEGRPGRRLAVQVLTTTEARLRWLQSMLEMQCQQAEDGYSALIHRLAAIMKKLGGLQCLDLVSAVVAGEDLGAPGRIVYKDGSQGFWHQLLPRRAAEVLHITTAAVIQSKARLLSLSLYATQRGGCIEAAGVASVLSRLNVEELAAALASVGELNLTFSPRIRPSSPEKDEYHLMGPSASIEAQASAYNVSRLSGGYIPPDLLMGVTDDNFDGIVALLRLMPQLQTLDLHMFNKLQDGNSEVYDSILFDIAQKVCFPQLTTLTLRGMRATTASLMQFIESPAKLRHLELRYVCLGSGTWASILPHLTKVGKLEFLRLSNLFDRRLVNLAPKDDAAMAEEMPTWATDDQLRTTTSFPCANGPCIHTREFGPDVLAKGLEFTSKERGTHLPTAMLKSWLEARLDEFGRSLS